MNWHSELNWSWSTADISSRRRENAGVVNNIITAPFLSSVSMSHDSETMKQQEQLQDPRTDAAKWNSAIINVLWFIELSFSYCGALEEGPHLAS